MTLSHTVARLTDLRFQESKIRNGSMAIADGFYQIYSQELWRAHPDDLGSFESYCQRVWPNYGQQYIDELVGASEYCDNLRLSGTTSTQVGDMTIDVPVVPSSHRQVRQLKSVPGGIEEQAALWNDAVEEAGGEPDAVTVQSLKNKIASFLEIKQSEFPLGAKVKIKTDNVNIPWNGYTGYIFGYQGKNAAKVKIKLPDGNLSDEMDIFLNWLVVLDEPPMPMPEPEEKPIKQSLSDRHKVAIGLLQRVVGNPSNSSLWLNDIKEFLK